jgi:F420H2 dehydrogenase subunit N
MYFLPPRRPKGQNAFSTLAALLLASAGVLAMGLWPDLFIKLAVEAAHVLF